MHDISTHIGKTGDAAKIPTELQLNKDISITFWCELGLADPRTHQHLFAAANALEGRHHTNPSIVVKKVTLANAKQEEEDEGSNVNFDDADASLKKPEDEDKKNDRSIDLSF